jgi:hypothetical protein
MVTFLVASGPCHSSLSHRERAGVRGPGYAALAESPRPRPTQLSHAYSVASSETAPGVWSIFLPIRGDLTSRAGRKNRLDPSSRPLTLLGHLGRQAGSLGIPKNLGNPENGAATAEKSVVFGVATANSSGAASVNLLRDEVRECIRIHSQGRYTACYLGVLLSTILRMELRVNK